MQPDKEKAKNASAMTEHQRDDYIPDEPPEWTEEPDAQEEDVELSFRIRNAKTLIEALNTLKSPILTTAAIGLLVYAAKLLIQWILAQL